MIVHNTIYFSKQKDPIDNVTEVTVGTYYVESGEECGTNLQLKLSSTAGYISALDFKATQQTGIYLLARAKKGTATWVGDNYVFSADASAVFFVSFNALNLAVLDVAEFPILEPYPASSLLLYYPSGIPEYGVPEILLLSHVKYNETGYTVGLLIYGFETVTCAEFGDIPESHNPFATASCPSSSRCLAAAKTYSLHCTDLLTSYTCASTCGSKHFLDGKVCRPCHFACESCFGPLNNQCFTCVGGMTHNALTQECVCDTHIEKGLCGSLHCASGYSYERTCVNRCPSHTFAYTDYANAGTTSPRTTVNAPTAQGSLEFSASSPACLKLPGPPGAELVPEQFTVSIWIYLPSISNNVERPILWAFNTFELNLVSGTNSVKPQFVLKKAGGATIKTSDTSSSLSAIQTGKWNYIAVSVRKEKRSFDLILYTTVEAEAAGTALTYFETNGFSYPTYTNNMILQCTGTLKDNELIVNSIGGYSLYARNLVYKKRFHSLASLHAIRNRNYIPGLDSYKEILSYWIFDSSSSSLLRDSAQGGSTVALPGTNNPRVTTTEAFAQVAMAWDDGADCIDVFSLREFPHFSVSPTSYPYSMIEQTVNTYYAGTVQDLFGEGDVLSFRQGGCGERSKKLQEYRVGVSHEGVAVEREKPLPAELHGLFVDVCYFSASLVNPVRIGQVYFMIPPTRVYPSHGNSDLQVSTTFTFRLEGGDQSWEDVVVLHNVDSDHQRSFHDSVPVNEMGRTYSLYSMAKDEDYTFKSSVVSMDVARYTLLWKPGYIHCKTENYLAEYKNLFVLWNVQDAPKIRFKMLDESLGVVKTGITYKAEYFYLETVGQYQSDGDQIIFCNTGCHHNNRQGPIFTRKNGMYPPVWMGLKAGIPVEYKTDSSAVLDDKFFVCWRPAARAALLEPNEDSWSTVYEEQSGSATRAYVRVNGFEDNSGLPEIVEMNPPITERILKRGESIWFKMNNCPRPSADKNGVPGKVEVVHLAYTSSDGKSYEKEVIWEQSFTATASFGTPGESSATEYTVGKLHGDSVECNYTVTRLPVETLVPGDHYMLIIYSNSFMTSDGNFFLGALASGIPQLEYEFVYQEAVYDEGSDFIPQGTTEIEITGTGIGKTEVPGLGTKRFFGAKVSFSVTNPSSKCNIQSAFNIVSYLYSDTISIKLSNLDLTGCDGDISATIQLLKLFEGSSPPLWTSEEQKVKVGTIGCNSFCNTCNGPTVYNCTSCATDPYLYLYRGACVAQCESDLPVGLPVYSSEWWLPIFYVCVDKCPVEYYHDDYTNTCLQCNSVCQTCTSDSAMSCLSCKSMVADSSEVPEEVDGKAYLEKFFVANICTSSCPVVANDFSPTGENLFQTDPYARICTLKDLPSGEHPISVSIQFLAYSRRVNVQSSTRLRALIDDPTHSLEHLHWYAHPAEDFTKLDFESSDERTFVSYADGALEKTVVELNMNSLNYKTNADEKVIIVKGRTKDSIGLGFMELVGNLAFDFKKSTVTIKNNKTLCTMQNMELTITGVEDPDDTVQFIKVMVSLKPTTLVYDGVKVDPSLQDSLPMLAALPSRTVIVYNSKTLLYSSDVLTIKDIYVPPLVDGPQRILEGVVLDALTCEVTVTIEDRHKGEASTRFEANFTELYRPANRLAVLQSLHSDVARAAAGRSFTWDLVLAIANTFNVVLPQPNTPLMFYANCSNDEHCEFGKCMTSGGYSSCHCAKGYTGQNCNWLHKELDYGKTIVAEALLFLNETLLIPFNSKGMYYFGDDINILTQLSNALNGLLINHELVPENALPIIAGLCKYLGASSVHIPLRITEDDKDLILRAFDASLSFLLSRLKSSIFWYYVYAEARQTDQEYGARYTELKEQTGDYVMTIRDSLYEFLLKLTVGQFAGNKPFKKKYNLFEVFINADLNETLYSVYRDALTIDLPSGTTYMKIPVNLLESVKTKLARGEEFMLRIINWFDSPYVFSRHTSQVFTSVYSFTVLNPNMTELKVNLENPAVVFLAISNFTKDFDYEGVKCREFNDLLETNLTRVETIKEPLTIGESILHVDTAKYTESVSTSPEFFDYDDVSGYGTVLTTFDYSKYFPCAIYTSGEVAAVVTSFKSAFKIDMRQDFYNEFDPMEYWKLTLGFYACMGMIGLFGAFYAVSYVLDKIFIPRLEKLIEANRQVCSQGDEVLLQVKGSPHPSRKARKFTDDSKEFDGNKNMHNKSSSIFASISVGNKLINASVEQIKKEVMISEPDLSGENMEAENVFDGDKSGSKDHGKAAAVTNDGGVTTSIMEMRTRDGNEVRSLRSKAQKTLQNPHKNSRAENVFSVEHKKERERREFRFLNLFLHANPVVNLVLRTNTTFHRTTRCIMLFLNIYLQMFWSAVFIAGTSSPLKQPDDFRKVTEMVGENMWIPCSTPVFSFILLYFFALLFKVSDDRVLNVHSFSQYVRLQRALKKEMWLKQIMAYVIAFSASVGINFYICKFSANYGWKRSSVWFWSFILGLCIESGVYDVCFAGIELFCYRFYKPLGLFIHSIRQMKQAGIQE